MIHLTGIEFALQDTMPEKYSVIYFAKRRYRVRVRTACLSLIGFIFLSSTAWGQFTSQASYNSLNTADPTNTTGLTMSNPMNTETQTPTHTQTPTPTKDISETPTSTSTLTPTSTSTELIGNTATPTQLNTITPSMTLSPMLFAPIIANDWIVEPIEIEKYFICDSLTEPLEIPDNDLMGIEDQISVEKGGLLVDLEVYLNIDHTWIGDLIIRLESSDTGYSTLLINRPGFPQSNTGCGLDNIRAIFDDQASQDAQKKCLGYPAAIAGIYKPENLLSKYKGIPVSGNWRLMLSDNYETDTGKLNKWCLHFSLSKKIPPPTPTQPPEELPDNARIYGISGKDQALPLDCESRSAVDWSQYFGVYIDEFEFLYALPESDNPDVGFVGDVNGVWGQIPPYDYGVHAEPVAALLRDYGLSAVARKSLSWDDIRYEIASYRPVIAWVIGNVINGAPTYYLAQSDQKITIVAKYEHTVIVIGYTPNSVIILDGDEIYEVPLDRFLESWSALNNMAVLAQPSKESVNP